MIRAIGNAIDRGHQRTTRTNQWFKGMAQFCAAWALLALPPGVIVLAAWFDLPATVRGIIEIGDYWLVLLPGYGAYAWYMYTFAMAAAPLILGKRTAKALGKADFATSDILRERGHMGTRAQSGSIYLGRLRGER